MDVAAMSTTRQASPLQALDLTAVKWNPPADTKGLSQATADVLDSHCLPPRPDPLHAPISYATWQNAMSAPLSFISGSKADIFVTGDAMQSAALADRAICQATSWNWSGGVVRPPGSGSFASVSAVWATQTTRPPAGVYGAGKPVEYRASVWVGLDGYDPASVAMPQIGTMHVTRSAAGYAASRSPLVAWWQWWHSDTGGVGPALIPSLAIGDGEDVFASVTALSPLKCRFFLKNLHSGQAVAFDVDLAQSPTYEVNGLTAEWIVERPTILGSDQLYPLPDYGKVDIRSCAAVSGQQDETCETDLSGATMLRMIDWSDPSPPGTIVSTPEQTGPNQLLIQYGDLSA
jgi:hypothetical protein